MKTRLYLTLLLSTLLVACGGTFQIGVEAADESSAAILGRWQRISQAGPGDPNELSLEYIEFSITHTHHCSGNVGGLTDDGIRRYLRPYHLTHTNSVWRNLCKRGKPFWMLRDKIAV
jgi:hypothetical protein